MQEPYQGAESSNNNPNQYTRIGVIIDVLDDQKLNDNSADNPDAYFSVKVQWLDRGGQDGSFNSRTGIIPLSYSHISRGWGNGLHCPSKGDIVACSFRLGGYVVIENYLPSRYYAKVLGNDSKGYYFRQLIEGEYYTKSKQGAEWYLDRMGSAHLLVRDTSRTDNVNIDLGFEKITDTVVQDNALVEVVVGKAYETNTVGNSEQYDFTNEIKSSAGNSIRLKVEDFQTGTKIIIDSAGHIEINSTGNCTANITGNLNAVVTGDIDLSSDGNVLISKSNNVDITASQSIMLNGSQGVVVAPNLPPDTPITDVSQLIVSHSVKGDSI